MAPLLHRAAIKNVPHLPSSYESTRQTFWETVCKTVCPRPICYRTVMSVLSVTLVYCGQTIGWIKMKLGTEIGLEPGHIVLDGNPALLPERGKFYFQLTFN